MADTRTLEQCWDCYAGRKGDKSYLVEIGLNLKACSKDEARQRVDEIIKILKYAGGYHHSITELQE